MREPLSARLAGVRRVGTWLVLGLTTSAGAGHSASIETERLYLSGIGKDDAVVWDFRMEDDQLWSTLPVPSNWELHGFGTYNYGHDDAKARDVGLYRRFFEVPAAWQGGTVDLVFDGVMTDADVRINDVPAGAVHRGGFYRFRYDVTELLSWDGDNLLEVRVSEHSADASVNRAERDADYWTFGGIYRPVFLEKRPREAIREVAVDARADGGLRVDVELQGVTSAAEVRVEVFAPSSRPVGPALIQTLQGGTDRVRVEGDVGQPLTWSAESPSLHTLRVELRRGEAVLHRERRQIGFRTVELRRDDGLYVNGRRVRLKGVNRHSFWPDSGRTTSPAISALDVSLLKSMHANAVRTSHYPPDEHFLEMADREGLYVLEELAGWHDAYGTAIGRKLVREMVVRDRNHPSVILWSNGNEDGWNTRLDREFERHDPQRRPVLHPRDDFGGIETRHYPTLAELRELLDPAPWRLRLAPWFRPSRLVMPTEMLHGLYDGGAGAGLEDFWSVIRSSPYGLGGFLWAMFDEAVVRTDADGRLDAAGNHAPDGILGPRREREGSYYTVRAVWAPVRLGDRPEVGDRGLAIRISNDFDHLSLEGCHLGGSWLRFPGPGGGGRSEVLHESRAEVPPLEPHETGEVELPGGPPVDADALDVAVICAEGRRVGHRRYLLRSLADLADRVVPELVAGATAETAGGLVLRGGGLEVELDPETGRLQGLRAGPSELPLRDGPRFVPRTAAPEARVAVAEEAGVPVVRVGERDRLPYFEWRLSADGWLELRYELEPTGERPWGLGFEVPEALVSSVEWLGRGPYRVWGNRTAGQEIDIWRKDHNRSITGVNWDYPEFAGYHADVVWATLSLGAQSLTVVAEGAFLQLFRPPAWQSPRNAVAPFADFDLGFLFAIPPMGSKFHPGEDLEEGRLARTLRPGREGRLYLRVGEISRDRLRSGPPPAPGSG